MLLEIIDDGTGFTPYKLKKLQEMLAEEPTGEFKFSDSGFGLENVHRRTQLYYGEEYGLTIESRYQEGTRVAVLIPLKVNE